MSINGVECAFVGRASPRPRGQGPRINSRSISARSRCGLVACHRLAPTHKPRYLGLSFFPVQRVLAAQHARKPRGRPLAQGLDRPTPATADAACGLPPRRPRGSDLKPRRPLRRRSAPNQQAPALGSFPSTVFWNNHPGGLAVRRGYPPNDARADDAGFGIRAAIILQTALYLLNRKIAIGDGIAHPRLESWRPAGVAVPLRHDRRRGA